MTRMLTSSTALALVFLAQAASADVTPAEVWANWQALVASAGQELTFDNVAETGDAIEVTGALLTYTDDLGGSFTASIDSIVFADNGDGTVGGDSVGKLSDDAGVPGGQRGTVLDQADGQPAGPFDHRRGVGGRDQV